MTAGTQGEARAPSNELSRDFLLWSFRAYAGRVSIHPWPSIGGRHQLGVVHPLFERLGELVGTRWRAKDHDERMFPDIARAALEEMSPAEHLSLEEVVAAVFDATTAPRQHLESKFGEPPVIVFLADGFLIELLFWISTETNIHEHGFSGAFHVLEGASLQARYTFEEHERVSRDLLFGEIRLQGVDLLERGATVSIRAGREFAHMTFHLAVPTVSLVVRTLVEVDWLPQYSYLPPCIAVASETESRNPLRTRQLEVLRTLYSIAAPGRSAALQRLLARCDLPTTLQALEIAWTAPSEASRVPRSLTSPASVEEAILDREARARADMLDIARRRHGPRIDSIAAVLDDASRRDHLGSKRSLLGETEHRLVLALALDPPPRKRLLEIVAARAEGRPPIDALVDWVSKIAAADRGRPAREPVRVLGTDDLDDDALRAFRCDLEGLSAQQTVQAFGTGPRNGDALGERDVLDLHRRLRQNPVLGPLLRT